MVTTNKPDGYYHGRITLFLAPVSAAFGFLAMLIATADVLMAIAGAVAGLCGCAIGLVIDPDLDQEMVTSSEWRMIKAPESLLFGPLRQSRIAKSVVHAVGAAIGGIWVGLWMPYALLMPHRSALSHFPIVSTVIRCAYLYIISWVGRWLIFKVTGWYLWVWLAPEGYQILTVAIIGLMLSDLGHYLRDTRGLTL